MPYPANPWDEVYKKQGAFFTDAHEDMPGLVLLFQQKQVKKVLDLGCGSGRHVMYLARYGFSLYGFDKSPAGLEITRTLLKNEGLAADLRFGEMTEELPYADGFFDAVVSTQVIHHAVLSDIKKIVTEILRVLKTGGPVFITVPTTMNQGETYKEIEPGTFAPLDGREKGLPHHFFTEETLRSALKDFEITDMHIDKAAHFAVTGFKR